MKYDVVIVGSGIAGASLAFHLAARASVLLIEGETQPGYHTTGRSAAFYAETYGGPVVQPLTTASKSFFEAPPEGFAGVPLLRPRGGLHIAQADAVGELARLEQDFRATSVRIDRLEAGDAAALVPQLRDEWLAGALWEPDCRDIDVAALHHGFLAGARRAGATLVADATVGGLRAVAGGWAVETSAGVFSASVAVNAAGAWGDEIARLAEVAPLGLMPLRRTVVVLDVDPAPPADLPLVIAADGSLYFKPDAGRLWVSPHDEVPSSACDAQPEDYDVALAIDRLERATTWRVKRRERAWAGLRTFAPDRIPVYGFDPGAPGFFWCVGQGGFGIQTAPAAGRLAAALLLGQPVPDGLDPNAYGADRLR
jgi:D-arginine dehydrogenase